MKQELTQCEVQRLLDYNQETGVFTWRVRRQGTRKNKEAGCIHHEGYRVIGCNGNWVLAHRLAVLWMTGELPNGEVDHVDRNRSNNAWSNLRVVTHSQNQRNSSMARRNKSGFKGVCQSPTKGKWCASIRVNGKSTHLGTFDQVEDAAQAYRNAAEKYYGEFANY